MLLTQISQSDYEDLCRLHVLGLQDAPVHEQNVVYSELKEQLQRSPEGSLRHLSSLTKNLQLKIEAAPKLNRGKKYYIPHKGVYREAAKTTKMGIVYDASVKVTP